MDKYFLIQFIDVCAQASFKDCINQRFYNCGLLPYFDKFKVILFSLVLSLMLFSTTDIYAAAEDFNETIYTGFWFPINENNKNNFDESISDNSSDIAAELGRFAREEIQQQKYHNVIEKLKLKFPDSGNLELKSGTRLLTIVLSRATVNMNEYTVTEKKFFQYFFDVTLSVIVVNPDERNSSIVYTRILTFEQPVLETIKLEPSGKKKYFMIALQKAISELMEKTGEEFKSNPTDEIFYYFQVTNMKIKPEAEEGGIAKYEINLMQFLHDALVYRAKEKGLKIHFLPPALNWDSKMWEEFKNRFKVTALSDRGHKKAKNFNDNDRLLTISGVLNKTTKKIVKETNLESYYGFMAFTSGAVILRDKCNDEDIVNCKRKAICPESESDDNKKIAKGEAYKEFHDIKGMTASPSAEMLFLDASQTALGNLSNELILLCEKSYKERLKL